MKLIENAPWWLVSAGIHAVLILGAALIYVERLMAIEPDKSPIVILPPEPERIEAKTIRELTSNTGAPLKFEDPDPNVDPNEKAIFFPGAEFSNKNRSKETDPEFNRDEMRGQDKKFLSSFPGESGAHTGRLLKGFGEAENIGIGRGGGSAGRYGGRWGSNRDTCVRVNGGDPRTESAVTAALRWLARHQDVDGSWSAEGFSHKCVNGKCSGEGEHDFDTGVTSLSLLAFLGAGYTQLSKDELVDPAVPGQTLHMSEVVKRALQCLVAHQDPEGCVGERGQKYLYNHAVAALALSEAFGMTASEPLREPAQKAINFLVAAENPGKGWRYSARSGDNDTSVTGWAVMALKSAEISGLPFPRSAFEGALSWLKEATETNGYYRAGYNQAGTGKVYVPGKNEQFSHHESMSAVAVMSRIFIQKKREPELTAVNLLVSDLPAWKPGQVDFYYWYYASLALFQYDGPKGAFWAKWNEPMKNTLVPNQKTSSGGCENGSWDPSADRWGFEGGRVYATAINCLTLEVYYRYANVFGTSK
jgi:hypothetical protein